MVATMTRPGRAPSTIQNVLDAEVDVMSLPLTGNLDPVLEARNGSMRPATFSRSYLRYKRLGLAKSNDYAGKT